MLEQQPVMWGIHAGRNGEADSQFLDGNSIAVGWKKCGNLSELPANRDAFKAKVQECYPESKSGAIPVFGGILYRFVHDMQVGDLVAYPSKLDKAIHLGKIIGEYSYDPASSNPNTRAVQWTRTVSRTSLSQGAL